MLRVNSARDLSGLTVDLENRIPRCARNDNDRLFLGYRLDLLRCLGVVLYNAENMGKDVFSVPYRKSFDKPVVIASDSEAILQWMGGRLLPAALRSRLKAISARND